MDVEFPMVWDLKVVSFIFEYQRSQLDWVDRGLEHIVWNEQSIVRVNRPTSSLPIYRMLVPVLANPDTDRAE